MNASISRPSTRFLATVITWALIALAQPGVLRPDGFGHLAFFAVGPWAWAASRAVHPGRARRSFLAEWAGHSLGLASVFFWMLDFLPWILIPMSVIPALYPALAGILLRRASGRLPLALTAAAAWTLAEVVRYTLPVPLSFGWFRLGMLMHDTAWLVGSAATFGTWGLTWGMAALGGFAADVARAVSRPEGTPSRLLPAAVFGLGPLAGLIGLTVSAWSDVQKPTRPGPDILIVQPGIEQEIKAQRRDPFQDLYVPQVDRTKQALLDLDPADKTRQVLDDRHPDLVLWGETFLPGKLFPPEARTAFEKGARPSAIARSRELTLGEAELEDFYARQLVQALFGRSTMARQHPGMWRATFGAPEGPEWADRVAAGEPLLPPGTWFFSGVEAWGVRETDDGPELASVNAAALWSPRGERSELASKVHLVPGGESIDALRFLPFVVEAIQKVASNVPDFVSDEEVEVFSFTTREGETYRFGVSICFDNAFDDVFTAPLAEGGSGAVDFFVIASNEAWYGDSPLMDHMLAFSRIAAAATHKPIVRATNSGISAVIDPWGSARDVLEVDGRRKMVAGALRARVPLPGRTESPVEATFFARTQHVQWLWWGGGSALLLALGMLLGGRRTSDFDQNGGDRTAEAP